MASGAKAGHTRTEGCREVRSKEIEMVFTDSESAEALTLITGVGRAEVTRHQVEAYCARRYHDQPLVDLYRALRSQRGEGSES